MTHQQVTGVWLEWVVGEMAGDDRLLPAIAEIHKVLGRAVEPSATRDSIAPNKQCPICKCFFWLDKFDGHVCNAVRT